MRIELDYEAETCANCKFLREGEMMYFYCGCKDSKNYKKEIEDDILHCKDNIPVVIQEKNCDECCHLVIEGKNFTDVKGKCGCKDSDYYGSEVTWESHEDCSKYKKEPSCLYIDFNVY